MNDERRPKDETDDHDEAALDLKDETIKDLSAEDAEDEVRGGATTYFTADCRKSI